MICKNVILFWVFLPRKVISPPFANGTLATAQGEISLYGC